MPGSSSSVVMTGADFKSLILTATKFPSVGHFGGSELVHIKTVNNDRAVCSTLGVVQSRAVVAAEGAVTPFAMDERLIVPFASQHGGAARVIIETDEKQVKIRARGRSILAPFRPAAKLPFPKTDVEGIPITQDMADRTKYLAEAAFSDLSRPDLCCVMMLPDGRAMACSTRAIVVLKCHSGHNQRIAMPLPLARELNQGDYIYPGERQTIIKNGVVAYAMPSPLQAVANFPVAVIDSYTGMESKIFGTCKGADLAGAVNEAQSCMGSLSRLEMVLTLRVKNNKMIVGTTNVAAEFHAKFPVLEQGDANVVVRLPMEEMAKMSGFLEKEKRVDISIGTKNAETMMRFSTGWAMFPRFLSAA